ncbi:MAG TPA: hypothetical protein VFE61_15965, partial [Candidatus Sulfotelmatobacter sp.]|nr:hypothetical protein [Candidatus Sulfotelmatobacter sp.]
GGRLSTSRIMAALRFKAVLIATPQMKSESGLTFRSKQSALWAADPRGRAAAASQQEKLAICPDST